jgi:hypothetical protein
MPITWPDEVDEIMAGDLAAALAYATPARGTVITPMAPLGLRDREAGTITLTTSLGLWKKLDRMRANPNVAVAYHARDHGDSDRPEFVLAQGTASFSTVPDRAWLDSIRPEWDHFLGPPKGGLIGRWLDVYYYQRVAVTIDLRRIVIWPDATCSGEPTVIGEPLCEPAFPQKPPKNGTGPRVDTEKLAKQSRRLPHPLLGWICRDDLPFVVAARVGEVGENGVDLSVPPRVVPQGGRRAGLTAHEFQPRMVGQEQRIHTGWLEVDGDRAVYAPHTAAGYRLPASKLLFTLAGGAGTRAGIGKARKHGLA